MLFLFTTVFTTILMTWLSGNREASFGTYNVTAYDAI